MRWICAAEIGQAPAPELGRTAAAAALASVPAFAIFATPAPVRVGRRPAGRRPADGSRVLLRGPGQRDRPGRNRAAGGSGVDGVVGASIRFRARANSAPIIANPLSVANTFRLRALSQCGAGALAATSCRQAVFKRRESHHRGRAGKSRAAQRPRRSMRSRRGSYPMPGPEGTRMAPCRVTVTSGSMTSSVQ